MSAHNPAANKDMARLVLMVCRRGQVEVAHHVARCLSRLVVVAHRRQVRAQPLHQAQHAPHPLMAGLKHLEGRVEASLRRAVQRNRRSFARKACALLCLARGQDDADRLFFERALVMEGDTELGLMIKNALDAIGPLWAGSVR